VLLFLARSVSGAAWKRGYYTHLWAERKPFFAENLFFVVRMLKKDAFRRGKNRRKGVLSAPKLRVGGGSIAEARDFIPAGTAGREKVPRARQIQSSPMNPHFPKKTGVRVCVRTFSLSCHGFRLPCGSVNSKMRA
jgi:hypothetical protein